MQAENELEKVNVSLRAKAAKERTNGNRKLLHPVHSAEAVADERVTLWERLNRSFPTPEELTVAGRQVTGFIVPHWAAGVLLAAILGCMGFMYSRLSDQRDMLIRLDTQLQERDKHEMEYRSEFKTTLAVQKVYIDNMTTQLNIVKTLLSPRQTKILENSRKVEN